jgi:phosphatidylglycerophosphatase A
MKEIIRFLATGAYSGYFPWIAGTFGTIPAWLIAWFFLGMNQVILVVATLAALLLSVWASGAAEEFLGHDSKKIVIDEWAGMLVSVCFLPYRLDVYIGAFLLFRFYDVIKPYPAGMAEKWPHGWGVTFDDIFAGVYANVTAWLFIGILSAMGWLGF